MSRPGAALLAETVRKSGLDSAISAALTPWQDPPRSRARRGFYHLAAAARVHGSARSTRGPTFRMQVLGQTASRIPVTRCGRMRTAQFITGPDQGRSSRW